MRQHFSEYFPLTTEGKATVWKEAIFVFDTNVLLNLYRLSRDTSDAIIDIMKMLKDRLFLPHQVGIEFYKHREEEIANQINEFENVRNTLNKLSAQFKGSFTRHPCIPINEITDALEAFANAQIAKVTASQRANELNFFAYTDPILPTLDALFADSSEGPYTGTDDDDLNKKVEERIQQNLPPCNVAVGTKASMPPATNPHRGDGRVWFQIVKHAEGKKQPIIFVTDDERPNWWRTVKIGNRNREIGPHFILIRDIEAASGNRFVMYTQEKFIAEASLYLKVPENAKAIEEVKRFQESELFSKSLENAEIRGDEELKSEGKAAPMRRDDLLKKDSDAAEQIKNSVDKLKSQDVQKSEEVEEVE